MYRHLKDMIKDRAARPTMWTLHLRPCLKAVLGIDTSPKKYINSMRAETFESDNHILVFIVLHFKQRCLPFCIVLKL